MGILHMTKKVVYTFGMTSTPLKMQEGNGDLRLHLQ